MIGRLKGKLLEKHPPRILLDVQGVGYELEVPMSTYYDLPAVGQEIVLVVHMLVREDAQLLYGFGSLKERHLFRSLMKVSGVGAKVALAILSGMSTDEFTVCIEREDVSALIRMPGIGKKTAERLIVEMRDKLDGLPATLTGAANAANQSPTAEKSGSARSQAIEALVALGYKPVEATRMIDKSSLADENASVEQYIRAALKRVPS